MEKSYILKDRSEMFGPGQPGGKAPTVHGMGRVARRDNHLERERVRGESIEEEETPRRQGGSCRGRSGRTPPPPRPPAGAEAS